MSGSLTGECPTTPRASNPLASRVIPGNINICFSFDAAVVVCSEERRRLGVRTVVNVAFRQDIIETKYV